ncbi:MAG: OmpA family protein [Rhodospirillaceae bacterium]
MKFGNLVIAVAMAAIVSACGGMELQKAEKASPSGDAFSKALYGEYVQLSKTEYSEGDYEDSDMFAMRAIAAADGSPPAPEEVASRNQIPAAAKALGEARSRLVAAFGAGSRANMAAPSAKAQAMYECWAQEQEENFQPDHIDACRIGFFTALAQIEARPAATPAPAAPAPAAKPAPQTFVVYFGFNGRSLDGRANAVLKAVTDAVKAGKPSVVSVIGHTDMAGSSDYNANLAEARANVVADALAGMGVPGNLMTIGSLGQNQPAISTADGVREARNRRVEVTIRY